MTAKHLIHIGYPKAGSTFLQAWFEQHPELCYAPGGLGGFYNIYEICRPSGRACKYFVTSFEGIATPHESAGSFTPDVCLSETAVPELPYLGGMRQAQRMRFSFNPESDAETQSLNGSTQILARF